MATTILPTFTPSRLDNSKRGLTLCRAANEQPSLLLSKRTLSLGLAFVLAGNVGVSTSRATILEADEDDELMERIKQDRKKRIERQGVLSKSDKETGYLQELVYKLSKVGEAIDGEDLASAGSVLTDSEWVKNANSAFSKLSASDEEKSEVDTFNSSLASLISSVSKKDVKSSKLAFVASASALEKWSNLTGLVAKLKGL